MLRINMVSWQFSLLKSVSRTIKMFAVLTLVFVISIEDKAIQAIFIDTPRNVIATERTTIQLNCATNDTTNVLRWFHRTQPSSEETMIYTGSQFLHSAYMYSVDKSIPGRCHLILNNTNMSSAGMYTCNEFQTRNNVSAEVIVITASGGPSCSISLDNINTTGLTYPKDCSILALSCIISDQNSSVSTRNIGNHSVFIQYIHRSNLEEYIVISSNSTDWSRLYCRVATTGILSTADKSDGFYKFQCYRTRERLQRSTTDNTSFPDYYFSFEEKYSLIWKKDNNYSNLVMCNKINNINPSTGDSSDATPEQKTGEPVSIPVIITINCLLGVVSIFVVILLVKQLRKRTPNIKLMEPDVQTLPSNSSNKSEELTSIDDMETAFSSGGHEVAASGDGTEYVDTGGLKAHRHVSANKLKLHSDTYASIDHTSAPEKPTQPLRSLDEFGRRKRTTRF